MIKGYDKKPKCSLTANIGLATQELSTGPIDDPTTNSGRLSTP